MDCTASGQLLPKLSSSVTNLQNLQQGAPRYFGVFSHRQKVIKLPAILDGSYILNFKLFLKLNTSYFTRTHLGNHFRHLFPPIIIQSPPLLPAWKYFWNIKRVGRENLKSRTDSCNALVFIYDLCRPATDSYVTSPAVKSSTPLQKNDSSSDEKLQLKGVSCRTVSHKDRM